MTDPDAEAFAFYDSSARREPVPGKPRRRRPQALTEHVPVRFPAQTIEVVRKIAEADGITVSAWIRRAVERTLRERTGPPPETREVTVDARAVVERLQRDVAELAAALDPTEDRRAFS